MNEDELAESLNDMEAMQQALAEERAAEGENDLFAAMLEAAYLVAVADGNLTDTEVETMVSGFSKLTEGEVSEETMTKMLEVVSDGLVEEGQDARIEAIATEVDDDDLRQGVFVVAAAVAWKDGGIGAAQGGVVRALGTAFGFSDSLYQQLLGEGRHS